MKSLIEENIICYKSITSIVKNYENISNALNKKKLLSMNDYTDKLILTNKNYINVKDDVCAICRELFTTINDSWICSCDHVFHKSCLCKMLYYKNNKDINCPLCRKDITLEYCIFTYGPFTHYYNILYNKKIDYIGLCDILEMNILKKNINDIIVLIDCDKCNSIISINNRKNCISCYNFCYEYNIHNKKMHKKIKDDRQLVINLYKNDSLLNK